MMEHDGPAAFRAALLAVPVRERDAWFDRVIGLHEVPADGVELPRGGVPYVPCEVGTLIELVERAGITEEDVVVDIGSGVGRALACVHLLTGAATVGIEIQGALVAMARAVEQTVSPRMSTVHVDAAVAPAHLAAGTVFLLYCPFGGDRLRAVLADLEVIAQARPIRVACIDLPLPTCTWLTETSSSEHLTVYRSR